VVIRKEKKMKKLYVLTAVLGLVLSTSVAARADIIELTQLRDHAAYAEWLYHDGADATTFVSVVVTESAIRPDHGDTRTPYLAVTVFSTDDASGSVIFSGSGLEEEAFDFVINPGLTGGRVRGDVWVTDESTGEEKIFTVDVSWTATGPPTVHHGVSHFNEDGSFFQAHFRGRQRTASATGTVQGAGVNWTPIPATAAALTHSSSGWIIVSTGDTN
jgi:hypothetical protein